VLETLGEAGGSRSVSGMLLSKEFVDEFASQTGTKHDYIHTLQNDYDYARCPAAHRLVPCTQCTDFRRRQQDRATRVALYAPYAPAGASFFKKNISRREPCPLHVDTAAVARLVGTFMTCMIGEQPPRFQSRPDLRHVNTHGPQIRHHLIGVV
jgi:hypothetical protein